MQARISSIDITVSIVAAPIVIHDWKGHRFTDLLTLLKVEGDWKIMNKVFHEHASTAD